MRLPGDFHATLLRLHGAGPEDVEFMPKRRRFQRVGHERFRTSGFLWRPA
jgi:hypothetical protein